MDGMRTSVLSMGVGSDYEPEWGVRTGVPFSLESPFVSLATSAVYLIPRRIGRLPSKIILIGSINAVPKPNPHWQPVLWKVVFALSSRASWLLCLAGIVAMGILSRAVHTG